MKKMLAAVLGLWMLVGILGTAAAPDAKCLGMVIRVGVNVNLPPFQYQNEEGEIVGLHVDILDSIAEANEISIEYVPFQNNYDALQSMRKNELDAVLGIPEGKYLHYPIVTCTPMNSAVLSSIAPSAFSNADRKRDSYKGLTVVIEGDTMDYGYMTTLYCSSIILKDSQKSAFEAMENGYADALIGVKDSILHMLKESGREGDYTIVTNYMATVRYSIALHDNDYQLLRILNRGVTNLYSSGMYETLQSRWIAGDRSAGLVKILKIAVGICIAFLAVAMVYLIAARRVRKMLQMEVVLRTGDLEKANAVVHNMNKELERRIYQEKSYNRLLDVIIEATPIALFLLDENRKIFHKNHMAEQFLKLFSLHGITLERDGDFLLDELARMSVHTILGAERSGEIVVQSQEEESRQIHYEISALSGYDVFTGFLVTMEDVTMEHIEQDARFAKEKNEALNKMIAGIAHEIKNPLTTISAAVSLAKTKRNDHTFWDTFQQIVPQEVERINRLIQNLVYYAKPDQSASEKIQISEVVGIVKQMTELMAPKNAVHISLDTPEPFCVMASRDKLIQVFLNLLLNSIEAVTRKIGENTDYAPEIRVRITRIEKFAVVSIWDNGVGMDRGQKDMCLQPFYTTKSAGTGLGLPISAQYIQSIGGTIKIDSEPEIYTKVTVFLPIADFE